MAAAWAIQEMATVDLKDRRLNHRLQEVLSQLGERPSASIPQACGGKAEMAGAYRLFENPKAHMQDILRPHAQATRQRMAAQKVAVLVQDTTEVDVTRPQQQVRGAGPLDGSSRRGVLVHPLHVFTPDGTPLGTLHTLAWTRAEEPACASRSRATRAAIPIEQKESYRWVQMLRHAEQEAAGCPATHLIGVADSEADIYELLAEAMAESRRVDWIVRACQDRAVGGGATGTYVRDQILSGPVLFTQTLQVRGRKAKVACETRGRRQPRESRKAVVEVRAGSVRLRAPWRADRHLPDLTVNVVLVREVTPPAGDEPVEWLLLSSLPIETIEQVRQIIQYYCVRWMIEVFFRVLKSGCRVEERRFEQIDRLLACLAVYLIVAWRTLFVCRLGRSCPQTSCEAVFEPAEWKSVWTILQRKSPPDKPPTLADMVCWVAQLGGYVLRKANKNPPGPQTVWLGLQRMHDFALCWERFGPQSEAGP